MGKARAVQTTRLDLVFAGAALLAPVLLFPLVRDPAIGIGAGLAVIGLYLASRSVAYPLALGGLSAVVVAFYGGPIGGEGAVPLVLLAWVLAAIGFELARSDGALPARVWLSIPVVATAALWILMLIRLDGSPGEVYGMFKLRLFAENAIWIIAGIYIGRRRKDFDTFLVLTLLVAVSSAFVLVLQLGTGETTVAAGRETLTGLNPIKLGRLSGEGLIVAAYLVLAATALPVRLCALGAIPLLSAALLAAGSRGPVLGVAAALLTVLFLGVGGPSSRRRLFPLALGAIGAVLLVQAVVPGDSLERSLSVIVAGGSGLSTNGRDLLWSAAFDAFADHSVFGIGTGGFAGIAGAFYPHNLLLEVASELGFVGLVLILAILASAAGTLARVWTRSRELLRQEAGLVTALLVATLVNSLFSGAIHSNSRMWLFMGVALGLSLRAVSRPPVEPGGGARHS